MTLLSVVLPVFQNGPNIGHTYQSLTAELDQHSELFSYELIFVNDGSTDDSWEQLSKLRTLDPGRVLLVNLTRNFGQVPAILAGMGLAAGDCVLTISADLQDPPALIPIMVQEWHAGHKLVLAERQSRNDHVVANVASKIFYRLIRAWSLPGMPMGGFDFFLIDRQLAHIVTQMGESNSFIQGLVLWPGYAPRVLQYTRRKRDVGKSQWSATRKIKYFIDGFVAYSFVPIRVMSVLGFILCLLGMLFTCVIVVQTIGFGTQLQGWSSIMVALLTLSGVQMVMLGVLGEYLWRTFDQARGRPLFLIERIVSSRVVEPHAGRMQQNGVKPFERQTAFPSTTRNADVLYSVSKVSAPERRTEDVPDQRVE